jgi:hypothetical protein
MTPPELTAHTRMLIAYECMRLQNLYCLSADRGDVEGFVSLFAEDGAVAVPEHPPFTGWPAIRGAMQALVDTGLTHKHIASNHLIEALSPTLARGSCYLIVFASAAAADERGMRPLDEPSTVGHYDDTFALTDAGWKFRSRVLTRTFRRADMAPQSAPRRVET